MEKKTCKYIIVSLHFANNKACCKRIKKKIKMIPASRNFLESSR